MRRDSTSGSLNDFCFLLAAALCSTSNATALLQNSGGWRTCTSLELRMLESHPLHREGALKLSTQVCKTKPQSPVRQPEKCGVCPFVLEVLLVQISVDSNAMTVALFALLPFLVHSISIYLNSSLPTAAISTRLLGQYDLSGALFDYAQVLTILFEGWWLNCVHAVNWFPRRRVASEHWSMGSSHKTFADSKRWD